MVDLPFPGPKLAEFGYDPTQHARTRKRLDRLADSQPALWGTRFVNNLIFTAQVTTFAFCLVFFTKIVGS